MQKKLVSAFIIIAIATAGYFAYSSSRKEQIKYKTESERDVYVRFSMEAYDLISDNYFDSPNSYNLNNYFKLSLEKVSGRTQTLATSTREAVSQMIASEMKLATTTEAKKNLALNTIMVVLYNLQPVGRNGILSTQQEKDLRQNVSNINPSKDLYQTLGIEKGANIDQVINAYKKKQEEINSSTSTDKEAIKDQIAYAKKVLTNPDSKTLYDQNQIEPTIFTSKIGNTLYLYISKISPTTFYEFAKAIDNASTTKNLDSLVLDMRGNVGGALDFVQNFVGLFTGQNQYAFDLFHQGKFDVQRTVQPKYADLVRYGDVAIITDGMSQSTAEVISSTFKRLHLGKIIGTHTRGWGTVENTYPITTEISTSTKYSLLLVNSITLRDDNLPIEGRGVDPDVDTSKASWKSQLSKHFRSASIIEALKNTASKPPIK